MAAVYPNMNCGILIDEFIRMATSHLLTVKGTIITSATIAPAGTPAPSQVAWKGYTISPTEPEILELGSLGETIVNTTFKSGLPKQSRVLFIPEEDFQDVPRITNVVYPNLIKADGTVVINSGNTPTTTFVASNNEARLAAENYLGRGLSDEEWNNLVAITYAESTDNQEERAWVMGTILNRTRINYTPLGPRNKKYKFETVTDIINQPSQYQPVTGTRLKPGPNRMFLEGPNKRNQDLIYGAAVKFLNQVPTDWTDFTSNDPRAYKAGTNINYMYKLREGLNKTPPTSKVLGGTIFSK